MNPDFIHVFIDMLSRANMAYTTSIDMKDPALTVVTVENVRSEGLDEDFMADLLFTFNRANGNLANVTVRKERKRG